MIRYFLRLAFNGADFHGWQIQENAHTIQAELNNALSTLLGTPCSTIGCGRTDTGVHANMFYAHFDTDKKVLNHKHLLFKINRILPPSIACYELVKVDSDSHARFDAISRTYQYFITRVKDPFIQKTSYFLYGDLNVDMMNKGAAILLQYKDFAAFSKNGSDENTLCDLFEAQWTSEDSLLTFTIRANRFLRNMVRAIVGTLLEIGQGKMDPEQLHLIIQSRDRSQAGFSVPAQGLFLTDVQYKEGLLT